MSAAPLESILTIDLDALAANHACLAAEAAGAEVAPVVKADGYGLGAAPVARRLWAEGARSFFVARLEEGEALRAALTAENPATIYVLDGLTPGSAPRLAAAGLTPRAALRESKSPAREMGLLEADVTDETILEAMVAHPILVNRPIVCTPRGVRLCRPSESVLDLLDRLPPGPFLKEDGQLLIDAAGQRVG